MEGLVESSGGGFEAGGAVEGGGGDVGSVAGGGGAGGGAVDGVQAELFEGAEEAAAIVERGEPIEPGGPRGLDEANIIPTNEGAAPASPGDDWDAFDEWGENCDGGTPGAAAAVAGEPQAVAAAAGGESAELAAVAIIPAAESLPETSPPTNAPGRSIGDILARLFERRGKLTARVQALEHAIAEHHATMQRLAEERKLAKAEMDAAGEERSNVLEELAGVRWQIENPLGTLSDAGESGDGGEGRGAGGSESLPSTNAATTNPEASSAMAAEHPRRGGRGARSTTPGNFAPPTPAGVDPATLAPISALKISKGRLERLLDADMGGGRNATTIADLETLIREGRLHHQRGIGQSSVDAIVDALLDWRKRNPVPVVEEATRADAGPGDAGVPEPTPKVELDDDQDDDEFDEPGGSVEFGATETPPPPTPVNRSIEVPEDLDQEETGWYIDGAAAATSGANVAKNPHRQGTRAWRCWDRGWQEFCGEGEFDEAGDSR